MNVIKNIRLLNDVAYANEVIKLEEGAKLFQRHSRIEFKILSVTDKIVTIRAVQSKSPADNYLSQSDLIQRTKEFFGQQLKDVEIHVHAVPYVPSPVDQVDTKYIKLNMQEYGVGLKPLVEFTGIDKTSLSAVINGHVNLSQPMKGMFYYFFEWYSHTNDGIAAKMGEENPDLKDI